MRRILFSSVACPAVSYFRTLSHKGHDSRKKVTEYEMCFSIFSKTFVWNICHSNKNRPIYAKKCISVRYSFQILKKFETARKISEEYSNIKLHKNPFIGSRDVPCGEDRPTKGRTDGQRDMTILIIAFHNFAKASENEYAFISVHCKATLNF